MRGDVHGQIDIILDDKIETPILVNKGLPEIFRCLVFLGAERRMHRRFLEEFRCNFIERVSLVFQILFS